MFMALPQMPRTPTEKLQFWRQEGFATTTGRLFTRRILLRALCGFVLFTLVYHLFTSQRLRAAVHDKAMPMINSQVCDNEAHTVQTSLTDGEYVFMKDPKIPKGKEKATLVMLLRNRELKMALSSMRMVEDRFNRNYHYPWTFLNDQPFTESVKKHLTGMASGPVEFVHIPKEHWSVPETLNRTVINEGLQNMVREGVIYGGSLSYRHMCRYNSGFFYKEEALKKYDWYWRVEPNVQYYCDINYDPFTYMRENNKAYGFVVTMYEFEKTIKTLWNETKAFVRANPQYLAANNSLDWLVDGANSTQPGDVEIIGGDYNLCHFWSNFEIGSLDFYRSEAYEKYFEWLDKAGGFFYERWGDAPVHSLALALFLPKDKIHHFADVGYNHNPAARCPQDVESHESGRCYCDKRHNFDLNSYSCTPRWFALNGHGNGAIFPESAIPKHLKKITPAQAY